MDNLEHTHDRAVVYFSFALVEPQAFAQHGAEDAVGDDDIVTQLRMRRNLLGDLIAAKDVQVILLLLTVNNCLQHDQSTLLGQLLYC